MSRKDAKGPQRPQTRAHVPKQPSGANVGLKQEGVRPDCEDDPRGVMAEHIVKLRDIFARLHAARPVADMDMPGIRLHPLKGELKGFWAVTVRANGRVIS